MEFPNIRAELARNGKSAKELAHILGVTPATFSNWMNGKTKPDIMQARAMADALGVTMDYLFATD